MRRNRGFEILPTLSFGVTEEARCSWICFIVSKKIVKWKMSLHTNSCTEIEDWNNRETTKSGTNECYVPKKAKRMNASLQRLEYWMLRGVKNSSPTYAIHFRHRGYIMMPTHVPHTGNNDMNQLHRGCPNSPQTTIRIRLPNCDMFGLKAARKWRIHLAYNEWPGH